MIKRICIKVVVYDKNDANNLSFLDQIETKIRLISQTTKPVKGKRKTCHQAPIKLIPKYML